MLDNVCLILNFTQRVNDVGHYSVVFYNSGKYLQLCEDARVVVAGNDLKSPFVGIRKVAAQRVSEIDIESILSKVQP